MKWQSHNPVLFSSKGDFNFVPNLCGEKPWYGEFSGNFGIGNSAELADSKSNWGYSIQIHLGIWTNKYFLHCAQSRNRGLGSTALRRFSSWIYRKRNFASQGSGIRDAQHQTIKICWQEACPFLGVESLHSEEQMCKWSILIKIHVELHEFCKIPWSFLIDVSRASCIFLYLQNTIWWACSSSKAVKMLFSSYLRRLPGSVLRLLAAFPSKSIWLPTD